MISLCGIVLDIVYEDVRVIGGGQFGEKWVCQAGLIS